MVLAEAVTFTLRGVEPKGLSSYPQTYPRNRAVTPFDLAPLRTRLSRRAASSIFVSVFRPRIEAILRPTATGPDVTR